MRRAEVAPLLSRCYRVRAPFDRTTPAGLGPSSLAVPTISLGSCIDSSYSTHLIGSSAVRRLISPRDLGAAMTTPLGHQLRPERLVGDVDDDVIPVSILRRFRRQREDVAVLEVPEPGWADGDSAVRLEDR